MIISKDGITIRMAAKDISVIGRSTQGVRVMKIEKEDRVVGTAKVSREEPEKLEENGNGDDSENSDQNLEPVSQEEVRKKAVKQTAEKVPTLDELRKRAVRAKGKLKSLWKP